jgi:hypothetical protein
MTPEEQHTWLENATLPQLVNTVIWEAIMEGTAHCGWTDRARDGLVKHVQESVQWAMDYKGNQDEQHDKLQKT